MKVGQSKVTEVRVDMSQLPKGANLAGENGEKCNNCGGYGYTIGVEDGQKLDCDQCDNTGARVMTSTEMGKRIFDLEQDMAKLREAVVKALHIEVTTEVSHE